MDDDSNGVRALHFKVPVELHQRLRRTAASQDRSMSAEARRAIEEHLLRIEHNEKTAV